MLHVQSQQQADKKKKVHRVLPLQNAPTVPNNKAPEEPKKPQALSKLPCFPLRQPRLRTYRTLEGEPRVVGSPPRPRLRTYRTLGSDKLIVIG